MALDLAQAAGLEDEVTVGLWDAPEETTGSKVRVNGARAPVGSVTGAPSSVKEATLGAPSTTVDWPWAETDCCWPGVRV